jgi:hypothetical protein
MKQKFKRIGIDVGGYFLILAGVALGWLPGPGGIPLVLAGLGLLSIHNRWARQLREYVLEHGGKVVTIIFPNNSYIQWAYDGLTIVLIGLVGFLVWRHSALWQISLATALFFIALFIASMNRDRIARLKHKK